MYEIFTGTRSIVVDLISCPQPIGRCRWHPKICRPIWRLLFEAPILHGRPTASWHPQLVSHWLSKEHARAGWDDGTFLHFFSVLVGTAHFTRRHTRRTKTHDRYPPCPKLNWFLVSSQSGVGPALNTHASSSSSSIRAWGLNSVVPWRCRRRLENDEEREF